MSQLQTFLLENCSGFFYFLAVSDEDNESFFAPVKGSWTEKVQDLRAKQR